MTERKTPWNPSRIATKRVREPQPVPTHCRYCNSPVIIAPHTAVYSRNYGEWPWFTFAKIAELMSECTHLQIFRWAHWLTLDCEITDANVKRRLTVFGRQVLWTEAKLIPGSLINLD